MRRFPVSLLTFCGGVLLAAGLLHFQKASAAPEAAESSAKSAQIEALGPFNFLVGEWRGVGMRKRLSREGAWQEKAAGVWEITKAAAAVRLNVTNGQTLETARFGYDPESKQLTLTTREPVGAERQYRGRLNEKATVLETEPDDQKQVHRVTLTKLSDDRFTLLFEKRAAGQSFSTRIAEVAYQRDGTKLAAADNSGPACIVTGGKGTIPVTYQGKTYYVCCTGCRDAFNDDPEGVLAEAAKRKK